MMLTGANFLTVAGAAAITTAMASLLKVIWARAPEPWSTWGLSEVTVFMGGMLQGGMSMREGLLLFVSGMVVAGTALRSQTGVAKLFRQR